MNYFQMSCNFNRLSHHSKQITQYLEDHYQLKVNHCCMLEPSFNDEDCVFYICQSCREKIEVKSNAILKSLWLLIDQDASFPFPDLHHKRYVLQDCWRDRNHPEIHQAIRNILKKMNVDIIELEHNQKNANFCGNFHYETHNESLLEEMSHYSDPTMHDYPDDLKVRLMEDYALQFHDLPVITYCNRCTNYLRLGHVEAVHLLDLIFENM